MLSIILAPFSWLYGAVMSFRNFMYDLGWKKSFSFNPAVISVGNLSVGGTGKTPMIEYLVRLLSKEYSIAVLSRGYGRQTQGFRLANEQDSASTIGDEPFQFYQKFKDKIEVAVCEDRVAGINHLISMNKSIDVILLDDAFQHRRVKPLFSILLTDFSKPFFSDYILPKGRLRESRDGSSRCDAVVVTKCSHAVEKSDYENKIHSYSGTKPVFFSAISYDLPVSFEDTKVKEDVVLVTGIANSQPLVSYVSVKFSLRHHFDFPDHHQYSLKEIAEIQQKASGFKASILTTEKDIAKLISPTLSMAFDKQLWFYMPIETRFLNNGSEFDTMVFEKIKFHRVNQNSK